MSLHCRDSRCKARSINSFKKAFDLSSFDFCSDVIKYRGSGYIFVCITSYLLGAVPHHANIREEFHDLVFICVTANSGLPETGKARPVTITGYTSNFMQSFSNYLFFFFTSITQ